MDAILHENEFDVRDRQIGFLFDFTSQGIG
jgi:hypothetical protein